MITPPECGFLNIYKSIGPTSYDCIRVIKRVYRREDMPVPRLGHLGTLDPLAEGVLPVAVGSARRLIRFYSPMKIYLATIRLGHATDTDDLQGSVIRQADASNLLEARILEALEDFEGIIEQVPPKYSAVSSGGIKAYKRARASEDFDIPAKEVTVNRIEIIRWLPPQLDLRLDVGPGTYIRSIARDLGEKLGVGGCVAALKRESDGPFKADDGVRIEELENLDFDGIRSRMLPPDYILGSFGRVDLSGDDPESFCAGKIIGDVDLPGFAEAGELKVYDSGGFIGVGVLLPNRSLKAVRVIRVVGK
jgi:tRNA pseudouridine55 synthase